MSDKPRVALVATARDEGPYILEWVAHHRLCGFDPIIIFQNDSRDGTAQILTELNRLGIIQYFDNPAPQNRQAIAYTRAGNMPELRACDYFMSLDLDELFCGFEGTRTIQHLMAKVPVFDTLIVNWRYFGSGGSIDYAPGLQSERFTQTHPLVRVKDEIIGYKTINSTAAWQRPGAHSPREPLRPEDEMRVVNASGLIFPDFERPGYRATDPGGYKFAQINHYAVRELWSFIRKSLKGGGNNPNRRLKAKYWHSNDCNDLPDTTLAGRADQTKEEMTKLDRLSDGVLGRMNRASEILTAKEIARLKSQPEAQQLYRKILVGR